MLLKPAGKSVDGSCRHGSYCRFPIGFVDGSQVVCSFPGWFEKHIVTHTGLFLYAAVHSLHARGGYQPDRCNADARANCKERPRERERKREREPRIHAFPVPILRANFSPLNFSPPFLATSAANVALQTASLPRDMGTLRFPQHTLLNHGDGTTGLSKANKSVQLSSFILNLWPWD